MISVRKVTHHGNERWRVIIPPLPGERRKVRLFENEADAKLFANGVRSGKDETMTRLMSFSQIDRLRVLRCVELAGSIDGLEIAVTAQAKLRVTFERLLPDATAECVDSKRKANRSWQYVENLEVALRLFTRGRESAKVSEITNEDVDAWLNGHGWSESTRLTYLRRLETFWVWAIARGYTATNATVGVERPSDSEGPIVILAVEEARQILETCRQVDPALLPYFAVGLFAGVRPDEIKRLRPANFKGDQIEVEARMSKTRRRRLVEVHPTLQAWLNVPGGEIGWTNWRRRWREVRVAAGVRWDGDVMRHSFCSYAYPIKGAAWTANESGHSEAVLFRRYRAVVTRETAEKFWTILPGSPSSQ